MRKGHAELNEVMPIKLIRITSRVCERSLCCLDRGLRSSEMNLLVVPFTRSSVIQQCAFSAAGPRLWNSLPLSLRSAPRLSVFKSQLKTYLFEEYYG